jgi:subtilisin family serine protease
MENAVKNRLILPTLCLMAAFLSAGFITAAVPTLAVQAAGVRAPLRSNSAITYTTHLPAVLSCYPQPGPDPDFSSQYDMNLINADDAWRQCNLSARGVTIAIIDSGVDLDHPDLQVNLLAGYDYWDYDTVPEDGNGHGTNVAGIAAAALNGIHVAGVAPTARILPVRVLNNSGGGYVSDVADGIVYAADRAQVLNLSLGSSSNSSTLQSAINYAVNTKGRLVVAAAGNCGDSNFGANGCSYQNQPVYPGAYSNVMAVAATTVADTRASFSNVGSYVDIAAPGSNIFNTYYGNSYASVSGTSQAAPHVAGLAALVWAKNPGYTATQVRNQIASTAIDLGTAGVDTSFGAGRIDVHGALGLTAVQSHHPEVKLTAAVQTPVVDQRGASIAPGRVLIKFKNTVGLSAQFKTLNELPDAAVEKVLPAIDALVLSVPAGSEWEMIDQLRTESEVEYAEPDYVLRALR